MKKWRKFYFNLYFVFAAILFFSLKAYHLYLLQQMENNFSRLGKSQIRAAYQEFQENCFHHPAFLELFSQPPTLVKNYFSRQIGQIERNYSLDALLIIDQNEQLLFGSDYGKDAYQSLYAKNTLYYYTEKILLPAKSLEHNEQFKIYALFVFSFKFPELISLQKNLLQNGAYLFLCLFILSIFTVKKLTDRAFEQQQIYEEQKTIMEFGQLAAGVAHDIRNPLTILMMHLQELYDMHENDLETTVIINKSQKVLTRINHTISSLMVFSRENLSFNEKIPFLELAKEVIATYPEAAHIVKTEIIPMEITGNHDLLYRMISNLLQNAIDAVSSVEEPSINLKAQPINHQQYEIMVSDNGCGVQNVDQLFQAFHTTKERGLGLGLLVIRDAVHKHEGKISVLHNQPQGICFQICIPIDRNK